MTTMESATAGPQRPRPLYQQMEAFVRRRINDGELRPGNRLDLTDLSRRTRISRGVVQ